ncbi:MAG TPA: Fe-S cluster assembly ATPase SufC, partial [Fusobacteria bacterium]|nr:Fe-S cluster assembly ATPase SufC [Fusobacteriota bacterium]
IDSGLDIDSLALVSKVVNSLRGETSFLIVTHYNRILDYVKPDFVHILIDGKIVKSGDHKLAEEVEKRGYNWL